MSIGLIFKPLFFKSSRLIWSGVYIPSSRTAKAKDTEPVDTANISKMVEKIFNFKRIDFIDSSFIEFCKLLLMIRFYWKTIKKSFPVRFQKKKRAENLSARFFFLFCKLNYCFISVGSGGRKRRGLIAFSPK